MATTRNERRRRWFLRTWATAGWLTTWRASVRAAYSGESPVGSDTSPEARSWAQFAADVRVPSGVVLEIRRRHAAVTITVPLTDPYLLIGNHPACGVRLDGLPREIQYAFFWVNGELHGVDLGINAKHPDEAVHKEGWWSPQDKLMLGDYELRVRGLPGIPSRTFHFDDHNTITLHTVTGDESQERALTRRLTLVGCAPDNGVVLRGPGIAPRQAALIRTPVSLWIVNLAEGAQPQINGRVIPWSLLDPHDEFAIGNTRCHVITAWPEHPLSEFHETDPAVLPTTIVQVNTEPAQNG
ncbi:MAG TPA: FHA domain-containing protein [Planctomycetaceae bacterium]|nr:FHA domain-containing protein [Planctomycetaceae bacterium]